MLVRIYLLQHFIRKDRFLNKQMNELIFNNVMIIYKLVALRTNCIHYFDQGGSGEISYDSIKGSVAKILKSFLL